MAAQLKTRNWLFVFYPESAPAEWREIVDGWQLSTYVSPLHDLDVKEDGSLKKAHYHGIVCFDGPKTYQVALRPLSELGCATCKPCNSLVSSVRYLCHLDSPAKAQYDLDDVLLFGGASLSIIDEVGESLMDKQFAAVIRLINDNSITEFSELINFVISDKPQYISVVRANAYILRAYLASVRGSI